MPRIYPISFLLVACAAAALTQEVPNSSEGSLQSDLRKEGQQFHEDCISADKKLFSCLTDLVHCLLYTSRCV